MEREFRRSKGSVCVTLRRADVWGHWLPNV